ncbi:hypothetical protein QOZ80_9AG0689990 [Eleusine coracana subsp. coracana]|nr:hypothetical protein QOZ80_9AG0689990 [Eleusine coracana subsp. coracana]
MATEESPLPPWSTHLPPEIAAAIRRHLPAHADRIRFAAVCNLWRAAAAHQLKPPLPWLTLPDGTFFSFPNLSRTFRFPGAAHYHGSCDDWLLLDHGKDGYLLFNPFSGDTVRLPGVNSVQYAFSDSVVLTSSGFITTEHKFYSPTKTAVQNMVMCPGHIIATIVGDGRLGKIAVCRTSSDFWLINTHDQWRGLRDVTFYDGKLYAVEDNSDLFEMEIDEDKSLLSAR